MNTRQGASWCCLATALLATGCMHYKEESGRKTEYNSDKARFETGDYASAGFTSAKPEPKPVSEKELDRTRSR